MSDPTTGGGGVQQEVTLDPYRPDVVAFAGVRQWERGSLGTYRPRAVGASPGW